MQINHLLSLSLSLLNQKAHEVKRCFCFHHQDSFFEYLLLSLYLEGCFDSFAHNYFEAIRKVEETTIGKENHVDGNWKAAIQHD